MVPFWVACRVIIGVQKGTIILTTTHMVISLTTLGWQRSNVVPALVKKLMTEKALVAPWWASVLHGYGIFPKVGVLLKGDIIGIL